MSTVFQTLMFMMSTVVVVPALLFVAAIWIDSRAHRRAERNLDQLIRRNTQSNITERG